MPISEKFKIFLRKSSYVLNFLKIQSVYKFIFFNIFFHKILKKLLDLFSGVTVA